jgi:hypothetical protein
MSASTEPQTDEGKPQWENVHNPRIGYRPVETGSRSLKGWVTMISALQESLLRVIIGVAEPTLAKSFIIISVRSKWMSCRSR